MSDASGKTTSRRRRTSARVRWTDRIAAVAIRGGGLGVIVAVLGILVYLVTVVAPLFAPARIVREAAYPLPGDTTAPLLFARVDEYRLLGLRGTADGEVLGFDARTGDAVGRLRLFPEGLTLTAFSRRDPAGKLALGFSDGSVILAHADFASEFITTPASDAAPPAGSDTATAAPGITQTLPGGETRRVSADVGWEQPVMVGAAGVPIARIDQRATDAATRLAVLKDDGSLLVSSVTHRQNFLTGKTESRVEGSQVLIPETVLAQGKPDFLLITSMGDQLYLAWQDGRTVRFDLRNPQAPALVEQADLAPGDARLRGLEFMSGEQSLVATDSEGGVRVWFRVQRDGTGSDGFALVPAHTLTSHQAAVSAVAPSLRDKSLLTCAEDGSITLHHMTSEEVLVSDRVEPASALRDCQITPKNDGLFAVGADGRATVWSLHNPHPETSLASLFGKVWYEGYGDESYTWQSSSGTDDFEPKLSLVPLIVGTLKATLYSMLFAVPIALLGAIYTSEFLDRRFRAPIKSTVELMASLPSVVLGFLAALVLAPIIENWVLAVLSVFAIVPLVALGAGYAWQILPQGAGRILGGRLHFAALLVLTLIAVLTAPTLAGPAERLLFAGDFKAWLDGRAGTGTPGTAVILWPILVLGLLIADRRWLAPALQRRAGHGSRTRAGAFEFIKFVALIAASALLAWTAAVIATRLGIDPRALFFGTYVQRNALVVGFVMGFAVIPIIYTIADDALSAVPASLRSASLGCGATRWQTATRVVLPLAMSGIFSALMVGLGRAVGETMIVLMAAGNTPLMDLNIFNGLRTLSANIAVELPEAVKDGSLYRVLFLAALMLFVLTFIVNTLAEIVRQRFRKRAYQL